MRREKLSAKGRDATLNNCIWLALALLLACFAIQNDDALSHSPAMREEDNEANERERIWTAAKNEISPQARVSKRHIRRVSLIQSPTRKLSSRLSRLFQHLSHTSRNERRPERDGCRHRRLSERDHHAQPYSVTVNLNHRALHLFFLLKQFFENRWLAWMRARVSRFTVRGKSCLLCDPHSFLFG